MIRKYQTEDLEQIAELFYQTVHEVNKRDYDKEQLDVWAPGQIDREQWDSSLLSHNSFVYETDGVIVGFGDIDKTGYLDRLYVHKDYQGQGIAKALCGVMEALVREGKITVHASITAKPFFEKRGYRVVCAQQVERRGILLTNYVMEKMV